MIKYQQIFSLLTNVIYHVLLAQRIIESLVFLATQPSLQ